MLVDLRFIFTMAKDARLGFTFDFSSSSNTGFLGRGGGEGIRVLSAGITGSDRTMPKSIKRKHHAFEAYSLDFLLD